VPIVRRAGIQHHTPTWQRVRARVRVALYRRRRLGRGSKLTVNGNSHNQNSSEEAGPDQPEADADHLQVVRPLRRPSTPTWLRESDLDALAQRFAPLDRAQARHLALALVEGSTPVEILILRLVAAGFPPCTARRIIAELRVLRERSRPRAASSAASPGSEVATALQAAARSYLLQPGNDEQAARAIVKQVNWSIVRARWFVSVNRDRVRRIADSLATEPPADD
jgi:hypothetical protein